MTMFALPAPERFAVPLAAYLALAVFTSTQSDPVANAESAFLALSTTGLLAVIAALAARAPARGSAQVLQLTALLATTAIWIAYQGPSRGAVVAVILLVGFAASAASALLDAAGRLRCKDRLDPGISIPMALGLQLMLRGDLLLAPLLDARTLVSLLLLPAAAGWSVCALAARFGVARALLAGGLAVVLAPGWTMTSTLAVAALATGSVIAETRRPVWRWAAVAALVLLPLWSLPKGVLFAIGAMVIAGPALAPLPLLAIAVAAVAILSQQAHHPVEAIRLWVGAAFLLPAAAMAPAEGRWRVRLGALLTLAAALVSTVPEAMAAGLALAALGTPARGAAAQLQRGWCLVVVLGTTLLSTYPWTRDDPRSDLMRLLGWSNEAAAFLTALGLLVGLGLLIDRLRSWAPAWAPRPLFAVSLLCAWALVHNLVPTTVVVNSYEPAVLDSKTRQWQGVVARQPISGLALDSHLLRGADLPPGTPVAVVELIDPAGEVRQEWPLRVGYDTAEWAVSRADLDGRSAPPPWISTVAPDGTFFAHRFRARFEVNPAQESNRLRIRRSDDLPAETVLSIYRLELRR